MNTISLIIILTFIGILIFISSQNLLFLISKNLKEKEIEDRVKVFVDLIDRISKLSTSYFYYEHFLGLSNLTIENRVLSININGKGYQYFLSFNVADTKITEASRYCILKRYDTIKIYNCENIQEEGICKINECKTESIDCRGPNQICIGDGHCNTFIGENCKNSPSDCRIEDTNKVCCSEDPSADSYGYTRKKDIGEECYCDNQCKDGLKCNIVDKNFKDYRSGKACCPEGKVWNGKECIEKEECKYPCIPECKLPSKWDWRNVSGVNYLNPIRNQGSCGSCWAFATIGSIENVYNIENSCPRCNRDLSEQFLISFENPCCGELCGYGCNGGFPHLALNFIKENGICDENCYPYKATDENCNPCTDYLKILWKVEKYEYLQPNINKIKEALICHGPLVVASYNWMHAVVLVGYDDDNEICKKVYGKSGCWIIRNSWGPISIMVQEVYHERGYGYIPYDGHTYSDLINYVFYVKNVKQLT